MISNSPRGPQTHHVTKNDLELAILQPVPPKCQDDRHVSLDRAYFKPIARKGRFFLLFVCFVLFLFFDLWGSLRALSLDIAWLSSGYHDTLSLESPISTMLQPQRSSVLPGRLSDVNTQFQPSSFRLTWQGLEKSQAAAERIPSEKLSSAP